MLLTKEQILDSKNTITETVDMPEWGGEVRIKALSISEYSEFEKLNKKNKEQAILNTIICCCVDDNGNELFSEDDFEMLNKLPLKSISKLFNACIKLNSIMQIDSVEKEAKNS